MKLLLALTRLALVIGTTLVLYLIYMPGMFIIDLLRKESTRWRHSMVTLWARWISRIIGLKFNVRGTIPDPPFFLVSNHLSYIDILPYFSLLKGVFIAKKELETWPVLGYLARSVNVVFIDRKNSRDLVRVNNNISSIINDNQGVILFPEGTTTRGDHVKEFNSSLLQYPAGKKLPVSYATITYRTGDKEYPADRYICWWGSMTFPGHFFDLLKINSIEATVHFGDQPIYGQNRKTLSDKLYKEVQNSFIPVE